LEVAVRIGVVRRVAWIYLGAATARLQRINWNDKA
jgi:hypothetical protein